VSEKPQALPPSLGSAHQTSAEDHEIPSATACKSHDSHVIWCVCGEREWQREREYESIAKLFYFWSQCIDTRNAHLHVFVGHRLATKVFIG
jgi:hypothetical protein